MLKKYHKSRTSSQCIPEMHAIWGIRFWYAPKMSCITHFMHTRIEPIRASIQVCFRNYSKARQNLHFGLPKTSKESKCIYFTMKLVRGTHSQKKYTWPCNFYIFQTASKLLHNCIHTVRSSVVGAPCPTRSA